MIHISDRQREMLTEEILQRFLSYVRLDTQSDEAVDGKPSTPGQWDLLNLLSAELKQLGLQDIAVDPAGFVIARIPSNITGKQPPTIGLMAHVDTAGDMSGHGVKPQVIHRYDGGVIQLGDSWRLTPEENPHLLQWRGQTIITTDGTTLLGADDKAGVAEIMAAASYIMHHQELSHGEIELIFTSDEETGRGMDNFPVERLHAACCYTLDGGELGEVEYECFHAEKVLVTFTGVMHHPGTARGRMVNALSMSNAFCGLLPQSESPESTDGRYGYYYLHELHGNSEQCTLTLNLRDFETTGMDRRRETVIAAAKAVESAYPGGSVTTESIKQYANMKRYIDEFPQVADVLIEAVTEAGIDPIVKPIRGGTDGARLSEMGIPAPNMFTGGMNFHSRYEWIPLPAMAQAVEVVLHLSELWSRKTT
ncbi:MAG: peptidase T [Spirochaetota bacterium]